MRFFNLSLCIALATAVAWSVATPAAVTTRLSCLTPELQKLQSPSVRFPPHATMHERALMAFHLVDDPSRPPSEVAEWLRFKNGANPTPHEVALDGPEIHRPSPELTQLNTLYRRNNGLPPPESIPSVYEWRVLNLRKGDTVTFGNRRFKLGEFLGAGNATHIYKIDGEEGALRIPFVVDRLASETFKEEDVMGNIATTTSERIEINHRFSQTFVDQIQNYVGGVSVLEADAAARFARVSEIQGSTKGRGFIKAFVQRIQKYEEIPPHDWDQFFSLLELMEANRELKCAELRCTFTIGVPDRQYVYDEVKKRWFVADAETQGRHVPREQRGFTPGLRKKLKDYLQADWAKWGAQGRAERRASGDENLIPGIVLHREVPSKTY